MLIKYFLNVFRYVFVLSDANFERYGITASDIRLVMVRVLDVAHLSDHSFAFFVVCCNAIILYAFG